MKSREILMAIVILGTVWHTAAAQPTKKIAPMTKGDPVHNSAPNGRIAPIRQETRNTGLRPQRSDSAASTKLLIAEDIPSTAMTPLWSVWLPMFRR